MRASSNLVFGNPSDFFIPNMSGDLASCPDRAVKLCQRLIVAENLLDSRIDPVAKSTLLRMARGTKRQRIDALGMVAALQLGQLDQIFGDDEEAINTHCSHAISLEVCRKIFEPVKSVGAGCSRLASLAR